MQPNTPTSSSTHSKFFSLRPPHLIPATSTTNRPIISHSHPHAETTPIQHAPPHSPHFVHPEDCTNPQSVSYLTATPRTSISPLPALSKPCTPALPITQASVLYIGTCFQLVLNAAAHMRQYVAYAKLITSANRKRSDGTPLDGRHGVSGRCRGSSWSWTTKCDTLSWFDLTRFRTTARVSKEKLVMFESSSKSRKSWNGRQMIWQCIPNI